MVSNRRNLPRRPARTAASLDPKPRILVFCEGQNTEPQYIVAFRKWCKNPRVDVEIAKERGVPLTLVTLAKDRKRRAENEAKKEGDENLSYDEVWCVFDVDEHPNLNQAKNLAHAHNILLAVSNPCFELWLLLHYRDNPGMQHRHSLQKMLAAFIPDYNKHIDFELFKDRYLTAFNRAQHIERQAFEDGEEGRNPSTGVHRLTRRIQQD